MNKGDNAWQFTAATFVEGLLSVLGAHNPIRCRGEEEGMGSTRLQVNPAFIALYALLVFLFVGFYGAIYVCWE